MLRTGPIASLVLLGAAIATPSIAQSNSEVSDADVYGLLTECAAMEVHLMKGEPEKADYHKARAVVFATGSIDFADNDQQRAKADVKREGANIQTLIDARDKDALMDIIFRCNEIYPMVEEQYGQK